MTFVEGRLELHEKMKTIVENVYYEPADNGKLKYPCIVYNRQNMENRRANNNSLYKSGIYYNVTYITRSAETDVMKKILKLFPQATLTNIMTHDGLYHENYNIYYRL